MKKKKIIRVSAVAAGVLFVAFTTRVSAGELFVAEDLRSESKLHLTHNEINSPSTNKFLPDGALELTCCEDKCSAAEKSDDKENKKKNKKSGKNANEKAEKKDKSGEAKCGEGKCGEGKCGGR